MNQKQFVVPRSSRDPHVMSLGDGSSLFESKHALGLARQTNLNGRLAGDMASTINIRTSKRLAPRMPTQGVTKRSKRSRDVSDRVDDAMLNRSVRPSGKFLRILKELTEGDHEAVVA